MLSLKPSHKGKLNMTIPISVEVKEIFAEARDMAARSQRLFDSSFLLLAFFVVPNKGVSVLTDRGVNEDRLIGSLPRLKGFREEKRALAEVEIRMGQIAQGAKANVVNTVHLLIALSRVRHCKAYRLLQSSHLEPAEIRREALALLTKPELRGASQHRRFKTGGFRTQIVAEEIREEPTQPEFSMPLDEPEEVVAAAVEEAEQAPESLPVPEKNSEWEEDGVETPYSLISELYPTLVSLGRNLTEEAYLGRIDPVVGREHEIEQVMDILQKRRSNNPCLIGEPGVGKTAIVEGVARRFVEASGMKTPRILIELQTAGLLAGTHLRGAFAERLAAVKEEVRRAEGTIIIFIDEIHTLIGAGAGDGPLDASNDLKAALARGEFPCIGATTHREYKKYVESDTAMERRFQPVIVGEPTADSAVHILKAISEKYEEHHEVKVEAGVIDEIVRLSTRYIPDRQLPDKAINILDLACARVSRQGGDSVEVMDVIDVVATQTGIPSDKLMVTDSERLLRLSEYLKSRVVGQNCAMESVSDVICRNYAGFNSKRPMGSILMVGPTGVGKTETVKVLSEFLFQSRDAMVRFDMSEFSEAHSVSKLIGSPPGYTGHDEGGLLTEAVHKRPYQVILFDEIEKAAQEVWNLLLQLLDEGHLTDARGKTVSFSNTVVMMTSNLGADEFEYGRRGQIGFGHQGAVSGIANKPSSELEKRVLDTVKTELPLELWNRIEEKLIFHPLGKVEVAAIARLLIKESSDRLGEDRDIRYEVDEGLIQHLVEKGGYDATLGARPMRQLIQRVVEGAIASAILRGEVHGGDTITVTVEAGAVQVEVVDKHLSLVPQSG